MIKAFAKPFFRQARTYRWFCTQSSLVSQLRTVTDDLYEVDARVATLKSVLSQTEAESPEVLPQIRQTLIDLITEGSEAYETVRDDKELVERLLEFQKFFLGESNNQGVGISFVLTSLINDVKMKKVNQNIILKKIVDALTNPNLVTLYPLAHLFEDFYFISQECKRSDVSDLLLDRINELLVHHRNNLSIDGKIGMMQVMLIVSEKIEPYKLSAMFHALTAELEEASFQHYLNIIKIIKEAFPDQLDTLRDSLDKKLNSFFVNSPPPRGFSKVFNFLSDIASDKTWDRILDSVMDNFSSISKNDKCIVLYNMAITTRVNEKLVEMIYKDVGQAIKSITFGSIMRVYFANKYLNIETDYVDFEGLQTMVFQPPFIQALTPIELFIYLENILVFKSIPDDKRRLALHEIQRVAKLHGPYIFGIYQNIMERCFDKVPKKTT